MKITKQRLREIIKEELGTVKEAGMRFTPGGNVDQSGLEDKDQSLPSPSGYEELRDAVAVWVGNAVKNKMDEADINDAIHDALRLNGMEIR
jgi:hypothetical protein